MDYTPAPGFHDRMKELIDFCYVHATSAKPNMVYVFGKNLFILMIFGFVLLCVGAEVGVTNLSPINLLVVFLMSFTTSCGLSLITSVLLSAYLKFMATEAVKYVENTRFTRREFALLEQLCDCVASNSQRERKIRNWLERSSEDQTIANSPIRDIVVAAFDGRPW